MARKRLTPPKEDYLGAAPETKGMFPMGVAPAPISRVAGDAATISALREVAEELTHAREDGRILQRIPLDRIEEAYLVRDRIGTDEEELESLMESLRQHGQRTPIEVTLMRDGRYGLISGWRRLTALRRLQAAEDGTGAGAGTALAILRQPDSAEDAYIAMVEENEIRLGLSYYERARIAAKSVEAGVFPTEKIALQRLFAAASRAKRSKIGSFLTLYHGLGAHLRFAANLPERLGLALARAMDADAALGARLGARLAEADPKAPEEEQALLQAALDVPEGPDAPAPEAHRSEDPQPDAQPDAGQPGAARSDAPQSNAPRKEAKLRPEAVPSEECAPGVFLHASSGRVSLSGPGVTADLADRLRDWLRNT